MRYVQLSKALDASDHPASREWLSNNAVEGVVVPLDDLAVILDGQPPMDVRFSAERGQYAAAFDRLRAALEADTSDPVR